jgi:hypothetical protein
MAKEKENNASTEEIIGEFLRKKIRNSPNKITDKIVADFLNIAEPTLGPVYRADDLYLSRLMKFCIILDEDLIRQFYYNKEPLKRFKDREERVWMEKIETLEKENNRLMELKEKLEDHIKTQKSYIEHLEKGK